MRADIHPKYHQATVTCSCGSTFVTGSTRSELRIEICSSCHPFYSGTQKFIDTGGRVDRFAKRYQKFNEAQAKKVDEVSVNAASSTDADEAASEEVSAAGSSAESTSAEQD